MELSVAGFATCPFHQRALERAHELVASGAVARVDDRTFATRELYREWLFAEGHSLFPSDHPAARKHTSSPFVWTSDREGLRDFVGGCDDLLAMAAAAVSAGGTPAAGDRVHVAFKGSLKRDGSVFDSSEGRDPLAFVLGSGRVRSAAAQSPRPSVHPHGAAHSILFFFRPPHPRSQVIAGFEEAVAAMVVGERKTVELSPAQAYGERSEDALMSFPRSSAPEGPCALPTACAARSLA